MKELSFNCEQMDDRFELAVDDGLPPTEREPYQRHLNECEHCLKGHQQTALLTEELPMILTEDDGIESRALAASRRAINRIESEYRGAPVLNVKQKRRRALFLLASWAGALVILWRAIVFADLEGRMLVESVLASEPISRASNWFWISPVYFIIGLVLLVAAGVVSLRLAIARD